MEWHGYGRAFPPEGRQIVGSVFHQAEHGPSRRLKRRSLRLRRRGPRPSDPAQASPDLIVDVAELIWEPIAD